jgi:hypothetical protein
MTLKTFARVCFSAKIAPQGLSVPAQGEAHPAARRGLEHPSAVGTPIAYAGAAKMQPSA